MYNKITLFAFVSLFLLTACGGGGSGGKGSGTVKSSALPTSSTSSTVIKSSLSSARSSVVNSTAASVSSVGTGQEPGSSSSVAQSSTIIEFSSAVASSSLANSVIVVSSTSAAVSSVVRVSSSSRSSSIASSVSSNSIASSVSSSTSSSARSVSSSSIPPTTEQWLFRGTPNAWGKTPMTWTGSLFVTCQVFGNEALFKISNGKAADWAEAYPSSNYSLPGNATYDITFNSVSKAITATKRTTACGTVASSSSSSSSSSSVESSSSSSSVSSSSSLSSSSRSSSLSSSSRSSSSSSSSSSAAPVGSHNPGTDCMSCHAAGKPAASKIFAYAGTVYKTDGSAQTNAVVKLMNSNMSMALRTMNTDANGNFYSATPVSGVAMSDLHPVVSVGNRDKVMTAQLITGSCNLCHTPGGLGGGPIRID